MLFCARYSLLARTELKSIIASLSLELLEGTTKPKTKG